jgi:hypothetical protein
MRWINSPSAKKKTAPLFRDTSDGNESVSSAPCKHLKVKELAQRVGGKRIAKQSNKAKAALLKGQHLDAHTKLFFSRFEGIYLISLLASMN